MCADVWRWAKKMNSCSLIEIDIDKKACERERGGGEREKMDGGRKGERTERERNRHRERKIQI